MVRQKWHFALSLVLATAAFATVVPSAAFAARPGSSAAKLVSEGFESGTTPKYSLDPNIAGTAQWGPVTQRVRTGSRGLWCAGSGGWRSSYLAGTSGYALFSLPELRDCYSAKLAFYYFMPSVGGGEKDSGFQVQWEQSANRASTGSKYGWPIASAWRYGSVDLSSGDTMHGSLSRTAGKAAFYFYDSYDPVGSARNGEGPTIDDVTVTTWKYGPVRGLKKSGPAGAVKLEWQRPWRSTAVTSTEERAISYRVWKAPRGTSTWTEITPSGRIAAAEATVTTFTHRYSNTSTSYRYLVQAWDVGSGSGYGQPVESIDLRTPSRPTSAVRNRAFTTSGLLWPRHTSGSTSVVRIDCYRSSGGRWVLEKTVKAKLSDSSSYSKYSASVKLPTAGTWKMRAATSADSAHAAVNSGYTATFRVK